MLYSGRQIVRFYLSFIYFVLELGNCYEKGKKKF